MARFSLWIAMVAAAVSAAAAQRSTLECSEIGNMKCAPPAFRVPPTTPILC